MPSPFILGSAYMEDDIRAKTDATGFCRHHFKMMYDYGNRLGNALTFKYTLEETEYRTHKRNEGFLARKIKSFKTYEKKQMQPIQNFRRRSWVHGFLKK